VRAVHVGRGLERRNDVRGLPPLLEAGTGVAIKNLLNEVSGDTLLVDIPMDKLGALEGISSSVSFIPDNLVFKVRKVFMTYLDKCMHDKTVLAEFKVFLLPVVLFDNVSRNAKELKMAMKMRLELLEKDDWSEFRIKDMVLKAERRRQNDQDRTDGVTRRVEKLVQHGELSKAYQLLVKQQADWTLLPEQIFTKLAEKYPQRQEGEPDPDYSTFATRPEDVHKPEISIYAMCALVWNLQNDVVPSMDQFRHEHLRQLFSYRDDTNPSVARFRKLYTTFVNRVVNADVPEGAKVLYRDTAAFAGQTLTGLNEDVRPLGTILLTRKLAGKIHGTFLKAFNEQHFKSLQYAMDKAGNEKIIHCIKAKLEQDPKSCVFALDGTNAFMLMDRIKTLEEVKVHCPEQLPYIHMIYGASSCAWYQGKLGGIDSINSVKGLHQGCTIATWAYAMGTLPMIKKLHENINERDPGGFAKFSTDDGTLAGSFDSLHAGLEYLIREGPAYGY
jgi:hypothetical protein